MIFGWVGVRSKFRDVRSYQSNLPERRNKLSGRRVVEELIYGCAKRRAKLTMIAPVEKKKIK